MIYRITSCFDMVIESLAPKISVCDYEALSQDSALFIYFSSHVKFCETGTTMNTYITPAVFVGVFWIIQLIRFRDVSFDDFLWQRKVNRFISYRIVSYYYSVPWLLLLRPLYRTLEFAEFQH